MLDRIQRRFSFATALRRMRRDRSGSAAVEFAMLAIPFLMMTFAIMETALAFFAQQSLETIAQDSARMILTGQAQANGYSASQFKSDVCSRSVILFNCDSSIYVDVQSYPTFASIKISDPVDADGKFVNNFNYSPGGTGDIVVVRLFYQWPLVVTGLGYNIANVNGNQYLLAATAAFRNEPW
jgi:Flp pilus assembly protein TadG